MLELEQVLFHYPPFIMSESSRNYPEQNFNAHEVIKETTDKQLTPAIYTRKSLEQNLLLGNESIKYASMQAIEKTLQIIDGISTNKIEYNTKLNQGQITGGLVGALKNIQTKIFALSSNNEPVPQSLIDIANIFINEHQIQSKTYSNLKHEVVEGKDVSIINFTPIYQTKIAA